MKIYSLMKVVLFFFFFNQNLFSDESWFIFHNSFSPTMWSLFCKFFFLVTECYIKVNVHCPSLVEMFYLLLALDWGIFHSLWLPSNPSAISIPLCPLLLIGHIKSGLICFPSPCFFTLLLYSHSIFCMLLQVSRSKIIISSYKWLLRSHVHLFH